MDQQSSVSDQEYSNRRCDELAFTKDHVHSQQTTQKSLGVIGGTITIISLTEVPATATNARLVAPSPKKQKRHKVGSERVELHTSKQAVFFWLWLIAAGVDLDFPPETTPQNAAATARCHDGMRSLNESSVVLPTGTAS